MDKKNSNGLKKTKLISILTMGVFALSLFAPAVSAVDNNGSTGAETIPEPTVAAENAANSVQSDLTQLRKDRDDFKNNRELEDSETAKIPKEKIAAKRKAIEAKREALKAKKEEKRKAVLIRLLDIQIKQLKNTRDRVANMPNIKAELKTELNTAIDAAVAALTAKKAEVAAATTGEQLKKIAKEIKDFIKAKRDIVKKIVEAIMASKADKTITAAEGRLAEIKTKIAELKAAGKDVSELERLLSVAETKISAAKAKAGKEELKEAVNDLKEAYRNMKNLLEKADSAD